ncbi:hypothetical protein BDV19DRAFT_361031 [Aspergillus venezuelensis]
MQEFPHFSRLPAELRIQIWEEAASVARVHTFDVCFPSRMEFSSARNKRYMPGDEPSGIYLARFPGAEDGIEPGPREDKEGEEQEWRRTRGLPLSPYASIRLSCSEAFEALRVREKNRFGYNNAKDLLHLRFGSALSPNPGILDPNCSADDDYTPRVFKSSLSDVFLYSWTSGIISTLQNARMIALEIADLELAMPLSLLKMFAPGALKQEVGCLAERLSNLEVLYVVDYSIGLGEHGRKTGFDHNPNALPRGSASKTRSEEPGIAQKLNTCLNTAPSAGARHPGVFRGSGVTYREVLDLEDLGWSESSSKFVVLRMLCEEIWKLQSASAKDGEGVCFRGVRVLKCS